MTEDETLRLAQPIRDAAGLPAPERRSFSFYREEDARWVTAKAAEFAARLSKEKGKQLFPRCVGQAIVDGDFVWTYEFTADEPRTRSSAIIDKTVADADESLAVVERQIPIIRQMPPERRIEFAKAIQAAIRLVSA